MHTEKYGGIFMLHRHIRISSELSDSDHIPDTNQTQGTGHIPDTNQTQGIMDNVRGEAQTALDAMHQVNDTPTSDAPAPVSPENAQPQPQQETAPTDQPQPDNSNPQTHDDLQSQAIEIKKSAFGQLVTYSKTLQLTAEHRSTDSASNKVLGTATKVQNAIGIANSGAAILTNGTSASGGIAEAIATSTTDNEKTIDNIKVTNEAVSTATSLLKAWTALTSFTDGILAAWNGVKQAEKKSEDGKLSFREIMKVSILSSFSQFLTTLLSIINLASKLPKSKTAQVMLATLSDVGLAALPLLNAAIKFSGLQKRMSDMKQEQKSPEIADATKDYYTYLTKQRNRQIGSMALTAPILGLKMVSAALQWTMQFAPKNSAHAARASKGLAITKILASATSAVKSGVNMFFATSTLSGSQEEASENYARFMALTTPNIYINNFFDTNDLLVRNADPTQLENSIKQYQHVQKCMELFQIPIPAMRRATSQQEQKEIFFRAFGLSAEQAAASSNP